MALLKSFLLILTFAWRSEEIMAKVTTVGIPLTSSERDSLCKFTPITGGYSVCQKVYDTDGNQDVLTTTSLDIMCDVVKEALNFSCSRCLTLESPLGSNNMVPTCALTADCSNSLDNEADWMYLTTQQLAVEVPVDQRCDVNGFKTVHEVCEEV